MAAYMEAAGLEVVVMRQSLAKVVYSVARSALSLVALFRASTSMTARPFGISLCPPAGPFLCDLAYLLAFCIRGSNVKD